MVVFPSKKWFDEVVKMANTNEEFKEATKDVEVDVLFTIEADEEFLRDMGGKKTARSFLSVLDMISKENRLLYRGYWARFSKLIEKLGLLNTPFEKVDLKTMSELSKLPFADLKGVCINVWYNVSHGNLQLSIVAPGQHEDAKFKISGLYGAFKKLCTGEEDVFELAMTELEVKGDMLYLIKNVDVLKALTDIFLSIKTE